MTQRSEDAVKTGWEGEEAVKALLETRGWQVDFPKQGTADLLVEDAVTVEVKTAHLSGRTDRKAKRFQFALYTHRDNTNPVEEDILILRCLSDPPTHFIIPITHLPPTLTKIDITHTDPHQYAGAWARFREAWDLLDTIITRIGDNHA